MKFFIVLITLTLISLSVSAKSIDQKKEELKKIYEAGGISKVEYEKSIEFLEKPKKEVEKNPKKKIFKKKNKTKKLKFNLNKKDKDKEEITLKKIEELGEIVKFDKTYYPKTMLKKFKGQINSFSGTGQAASKFMMSNFGKRPSWGEKYPGKMIQSMAMYEVFYASRLYQSRKSIERYKKNEYKMGFFSRKKSDEKTIRSLIGMNKGRENMRKALGMNMDTPAKEAIQKFWLLGEFLELGQPKKNEVNKVLMDRKSKLNDYKKKITLLKKKLEERNNIDAE